MPRLKDYVGAEATLQIIRDRTAACREMVAERQKTGSVSMALYAVLGEYLRDMEAIVGPTRDLEKELLTLQAQNEQLKDECALARKEILEMSNRVRAFAEKWSTP